MAADEEGRWFCARDRLGKRRLARGDLVERERDVRGGKRVPQMAGNIFSRQ